MNESRTAVYEAVVGLIDDLGYPPSVREIGEEVGLSAATVQAHLDKLIADGFLLRQEGKPRTLRVVRDND